MALFGIGAGVTYDGEALPSHPTSLAAVIERAGGKHRQLAVARGDARTPTVPLDAAAIIGRRKRIGPE